MGQPSYKWSVVDRNVIMRRIPAHKTQTFSMLHSVCEALLQQERTYGGTEGTERYDGHDTAHSGDQQRVQKQRVFQTVAVASIEFLQLHGIGTRPAVTRKSHCKGKCTADIIKFYSHQLALSHKKHILVF